MMGKVKQRYKEEYRRKDSKMRLEEARLSQ